MIGSQNVCGHRLANIAKTLFFQYRDIKIQCLYPLIQLILIIHVTYIYRYIVNSTRSIYIKNLKNLNVKLNKTFLYIMSGNLIKNYFKDIHCLLLLIIRIYIIILFTK